MAGNGLPRARSSQSFEQARGPRVPTHASIVQREALHLPSAICHLPSPSLLRRRSLGAVLTATWHDSASLRSLRQRRCMHALFEEGRLLQIQTYIHAYTTQNRRPSPCLPSACVKVAAWRTSFGGRIRSNARSWPAERRDDPQDDVETSLKGRRWATRPAGAGPASTETFRQRAKQQTWSRSRRRRR